MAPCRALPGELLTPRRLARVAAAAENAGFTLVTLEDSILPPGPADGPVGRIGAVERAAFAAASTSVLGVAPVVATTYAEPFHISSQLASLDHVSSGRAAWVVGSRRIRRPPVPGGARSSRAPRRSPARPATASMSYGTCGTRGRTTR
ncbi:LLM class flavin-dependent oxidoreductase [Streptomyces diastatochromogenes]|nr:LLM class flavin-dependent oxidoreductase [Streptomyces diastatochromogenes]